MIQRLLKSLFFLFFMLALILFQSCNSGDSDKEDLRLSDRDSGTNHHPPKNNDAGDDASESLAVEFDPACQLSGKWISNRRTLSIALNGAMKQAGHNWAYWEFEQSGIEVTVKKGLKCGILLIERSEPAFSEVVADPPVWNAVTEHVSNTGRKGLYGLDDSGECFLSFEKFYHVRGATVSHFENPDIPLEDAETKKSENTPGWEDWDKDGNPGVTFRLFGIATGAIYVVQREWTEYVGPTERNADAFTLEVRWNNEQVVVGQDPDSLPSAESWPSTEPGENFVSFVRVDHLKNEDGSDFWDIDQDADDLDLKICEKMREVQNELIDHPIIREDLEVKAGKE